MSAILSSDVIEAYVRHQLNLQKELHITHTGPQTYFIEHLHGTSPLREFLMLSVIPKEHRTFGVCLSHVLSDSTQVRFRGIRKRPEIFRVVDKESYFKASPTARMLKPEELRGVGVHPLEILDALHHKEGPFRTLWNHKTANPCIKLVAKKQLVSISSRTVNPFVLT